MKMTYTARPTITAIASLKRPGGAVAMTCVRRLSEIRSSTAPPQEAAEQQHVRQHAVREQMAERPTFHRGQHRVLQSRLDAARHIRRDEKGENRQHQQKR